MSRTVWTASKAHAALRILDERVAAMFGVTPKHPRVEFVPLIKRTETLMKAGVELIEVLGTCDFQKNLIRIVPDSQWSNTAVHEFVHLYAPGETEAEVGRLTARAVLVLQGKLPTLEASEDDIARLEKWKRSAKDFELMQMPALEGPNP